MTTYSYSLSPSQMTSLMKLVDQDQLKIESLPKRREAAEIYRFVKDYIVEKSSK